MRDTAYTDFRDAFFEELFRIAKKDPDVILLMADQGALSFEQIKVDLSIMNLPVTIVGVGAGLAYTSDGPTHHANQDIAALRAIPNMKIFNASDTYSLVKFAHLAYKSDCPVYIRFDKGNFPIIHDKTE